jgi:hypothetical protein
MRVGRCVVATLVAFVLVSSAVGVAHASSAARAPSPSSAACALSHRVVRGDTWTGLEAKYRLGRGGLSARYREVLLIGKTVCLVPGSTTTTTAPATTTTSPATTTTGPTTSSTSSTSSTTSTTSTTVPPSSTVAPVSGLGAGGEYVPVAPATIAARASRRLNTTFDVDLLGRAGVPGQASDVLAVMVAITVSAPTSSGWLGVHPAGSPPALQTSVLNFSASRSATSMALVRPGANGRFTARLVGASAGSVQVSVDVLGWIATSTSSVRGGRLQLQSPARFLNTQDGTGRGGSTAALASGRSTQVTVPGAEGATAVLVNITALRPSAASSLSVLPASVSSTPTVVSLSAPSGVSRSALVLVPVGAGGSIWLRHTSGSMHVVADVVGFVRPVVDETRAGRIVPLAAPFRAFDTREQTFGAIALGPGQSERWSFADFVSSVTIGGVSVGRQAGLLGTLTAAGATGQTTSMLSVSTDQIPTGQAPSAGQLYTVAGQAVANMVALRYDASTTAWTFNQAGQTHYLLDAAAVVLAD